MKKIPTIFLRENDQLVNQINPACAWVFDVIGTPSKKYDGTCCLIEYFPNKGFTFYKRFNAKVDRNGKSIKPLPGDFQPCQDHDPITGHWPGWVFIGQGPEDKYHREAFDLFKSTTWGSPEFAAGTYELCGPKINNNPEGYGHHVLLKHGTTLLINVPLTFDGLKQYLAEHDMEGIVWWHPDGERKAKIKGRDFGIKRKKGDLCCTGHT